MFQNLSAIPLQLKKVMAFKNFNVIFFFKTYFFRYKVSREKPNKSSAGLSDVLDDLKVQRFIFYRNI